MLRRHDSIAGGRDPPSARGTARPASAPTARRPPRYAGCRDGGHRWARARNGRSRRPVSPTRGASTPPSVGSACSHPLQSRRMRCPSCEVEVSEHQEFCDACGSRLAAPSPDDTQERPADGEAPEPTDEMEAPQAPDPSTRPIEDFEAPEPTTQPIEEVAEPTPQVDEEPDVASEVTEPVVVMAGLDNAAATTEIE